MIDDYTTVHTNRRPTSLQTSNANTVCTIIIKIFPSLDAMPMKKLEQAHPENGIDIDTLKNLICSNEGMSKLGNTFSTCMPELTAEFFDLLMERERLKAHDYCASADVWHLRKFDNVYLIDFLKLPLKSTKNYQTALDVVCDSKLQEYCSQFVVLLFVVPIILVSFTHEKSFTTF